MLRLMDHQTKQLFPPRPPPRCVHNTHDLSRVPSDQIITGQHGQLSTNITSKASLSLGPLLFQWKWFENIACIN